MSKSTTRARRAKPLAAALVMLIAGVFAGRASATHLFSDVSGAWYETQVGWLVDNGIASGYADGTFRPNDPITRAQAGSWLRNYTDEFGATQLKGFYTASPALWTDVVMTQLLVDASNTPNNEVCMANPGPAASLQNHSATKTALLQSSWRRAEFHVTGVPQGWRIKFVWTQTIDGVSGRGRGMIDTTGMTATTDHRVAIGEPPIWVGELGPGETVDFSATACATVEVSPAGQPAFPGMARKGLPTIVLSGNTLPYNVPGTP